VEWQKREEDWKAFWKARGGKEELSKGGKAVVGGKYFATTLIEMRLTLSQRLSGSTWSCEIHWMPK
jgi:hypothetical protein